MQVSRGPHWRSVFQFLYSTAGLTFWLGAALLAAAGAWLTAYTGQFGPAAANPDRVVFSVGSLVFAGLLFLPPMAYAFRRLLEKPAASARVPALTPLRAGAILLAWALCIALGFILEERGLAESPFLFPIFLLAVCLPVALLVWAAVDGIETGSAQRTWGLFSTGLLLSPAVILSIQIALGLAGAVFVAAYFASHPEASRGISLLAQRIVSAGDNPALVQRILLSYLEKPAVLVSLLAYVAVFTPLLEELFKTAGVWLAGSRHGLRTPAQGFAAGALCGAGFALVESLTATGASLGAGWAVIALMRAGTDVLHILTGGLMGWAVASALDQGRYLRLLLAYLGAVFLHGLWNALSFASGILPVINRPLPSIPILQGYTNPAALALVLMTLLMLLLLLRLNRRLRQAPQIPPGQVPGGAHSFDLPAGPLPSS